VAKALPLLKADITTNMAMSHNAAIVHAMTTGLILFIFYPSPV
jgi:hypothetical protein